MNAYISFRMLGFKKHYEQNDCVLVWEKKDDYEEYRITFSLVGGPIWISYRYRYDDNLEWQERSGVNVDIKLLKGIIKQRNEIKRWGKFA